MRQYFNFSFMRVACALCALALVGFVSACDDDGNDNNNNNNGNPTNCQQILSYLLTPSTGSAENVSDDDASGTLSTTVLVVSSSGGESQKIITLTVNKGVNDLELNKRYDVGNMVQNPTGDFDATITILNATAQRFVSVSGGITITSNEIISGSGGINLRCISGTFDGTLARSSQPDQTMTLAGGTFTAQVGGN